jgi:hypothetical protein
MMFSKGRLSRCGIVHRDFKRAGQPLAAKAEFAFVKGDHASYEENRGG